QENKAMRWNFAIAAMLIGTGITTAKPPIPDRPASDYPQVIQQTADMVGDQQARQLAGAHGLQVLNLTWEDTGRFKNSAVGPNISDMTIQVQHAGGLTLMPVIRFPNFEDKSADIKPDKFFLLVGNEKGEELHRVSLTEYLGNIRKYLS